MLCLYLLFLLPLILKIRQETNFSTMCQFPQGDFSWCVLGLYSLMVDGLIKDYFLFFLFIIQAPNPYILSIKRVLTEENLLQRWRDSKCSYMLLILFPSNRKTHPKLIHREVHLNEFSKATVRYQERKAKCKEKSENLIRSGVFLEQVRKDHSHP